MTADEIYAWEVANLPWIMWHVVAPLVTVVGIALRIRIAVRYRQGQRAARRAIYRNAGLDPDDYVC